MKIALTGDVMLGRLVDQFMIRDNNQPPDSMWGDVLPLLLSADLRLINLECVISVKGQKWKPEIKPFHFRTHPRALEFLHAAHVDGVTLANNHVLDFGPDALEECLDLLNQSHIPHTGAGTLAQAMTPMILPSPIGPIAVLALTDNEPSWEAMDMQRGVNYIRATPKGMVSPYKERIATVLKDTRKKSRFIIVSAHVGPNWGPPSSTIQALAHELLDLGADLYWGHSNHTPQGIEIYNGRVIMYAAGDCIDDYAVDPVERNDLSFLFMVEMDHARVSCIHLYPTAIEKFCVRHAKGTERMFLQSSMQTKCSVWKTPISFQQEVGMIKL